MAKYEVLKSFRDKRTGEVYRRGQEVEMTVRRANEATSNLKKYGGGFISRVDVSDKKDNKPEAD